MDKWARWSPSSRGSGSTNLLGGPGGERSQARLVRTPVIRIDRLAYERLFGFIREYHDEIAGWGLVDVLPNGDFRVTEVFLVKQYGNTGSHVDIARGTDELVNDFLAVNRDADIGRLKFWWHSHVDMTAKFSHIDDETATQLQGDFVIAFVGNKRGEYSTRIDFRHPFPMTIEDVPVMVDYGNDDVIRTACRKEIDALVNPSRLSRIRAGEFLRVPIKKELPEIQHQANSTPPALPVMSFDRPIGPLVTELAPTLESFDAPPIVSERSALAPTPCSWKDRQRVTYPALAKSERFETHSQRYQGWVHPQILLDKMREVPKVANVEVPGVRPASLAEFLRRSEVISSPLVVPFVVTTKPLAMKDSQMRRWKIGSWEIRIPIGGTANDIRCRSLRSETKFDSVGYIHPYIDGSGSIDWSACSTEREEKIARIMRRQAYDEVVEAIIDLLEEGYQINPLTSEPQSGILERRLVETADMPGKWSVFGPWLPLFIMALAAVGIVVFALIS